MFNNAQQFSPNGKSVRIPFWSAPLWQWAWKWNYIKDWADDIKSGNTCTDFLTLIGQLLPLMGELNEFDYQPNDSVVLAQPLTIDTVGNAQIVHNLGGYLEPVQNLLGGNITNLYFNGVLQAGPYTIDQPSSVAPYLGFVLPGMPTDGTIVTVDFTYYYRVHLDLKNQSSSNFGNSHTHGFPTVPGSALARMLFEQQEIAFCQVRI
jgi:hypothetical protein